MKKLNQTLSGAIIAVALFLPFAAQAQTSCAPGVTVSDGTCIVQGQAAATPNTNSGVKTCGTAGADPNTCIQSGSAAAAPSNVPNAAPTKCPSGGKFDAVNGVCNLGYTQLEPIPGLVPNSATLVDPGSLPSLINAIFKVLISVGALIAILSLTIGGVQYMVSNSAGGKNAGLSRAQAALWAIGLIAASWLILYTINPNLLRFSLNPCPQGGTSCTSPSAGSSAVGGGGSTSPIPGVSVNKNSCAVVSDAQTLSGNLLNDDAFWYNVGSLTRGLWNNMSAAEQTQRDQQFLALCAQNKLL